MRFSSNDGLTSQYLFPEPLVQSASYVRLMAQYGMSVRLDLLILCGNPGFQGPTGPATLNRSAYEASLAAKIGPVFESNPSRVFVQSAESGFVPGALSVQPSNLGRWDNVVWVGHGSDQGLSTRGPAGTVGADAFARWFGGRSPKHITVLGCHAGGQNSAWRKDTQQLLPLSAVSGFDDFISVVPTLDANGSATGIKSITSTGGPIETSPAWAISAGWWR